MQAGALAGPSTSTAAPPGPLEDGPLEAQPLPNGHLEDGPLAGDDPEAEEAQLEDGPLGSGPEKGLVGQAGPVEGPLAGLQLADGPVGAGRDLAGAGRDPREEKARAIRPPRGRPRGGA